MRSFSRNIKQQKYAYKQKYTYILLDFIKKIRSFLRAGEKVFKEEIKHKANLLVGEKKETTINVASLIIILFMFLKTLVAKYCLS